jgi:hypothetical protein
MTLNKRDDGMNRWGVLVMLMLMPMMAMAAKDTALCSNKNVKEMQDVLAAADAFLPQIPPEEKQFFETEMDSIMKRFQVKNGYNDPNLKERYYALTNRRLYYVFELRQKLTQLRGHVNGLLRPNDGSFTSDAMARVFRGTYSFSPAHAYSKALYELLKEEERQPKPFVNSGNFEVTMSSYRIFSGLEAFVDCNLKPTAVQPALQ